MADAETLLALAARCEAADGPDRALDTAIEAAVGELGSHPGMHLAAGHWGGRESYLAVVAPHFTRDLTAVRDLQARVLPGHRVEIWQGAHDDWEAILRNPVGRIAAYSICARTEEGARLAAILRAKAKEGSCP